MLRLLNLSAITAEISKLGFKDPISNFEEKKT